MSEQAQDHASSTETGEILDGDALSGAANRDLLGEIERLELEKQEMLRLAQSRQAEFENYRRRAERERAEIAEMAMADTVKPLLGVLDDFERALAVQTADANYAKGVELIHQRIREALTKLGVEPLESLGRVFDPNLHHGIDLTETTEATDQTILHEFQRGYLFKGKLLRPAMVRVAVNPGASGSTGEQNAEGN